MPWVVKLARPASSQFGCFPLACRRSAKHIVAVGLMKHKFRCLSFYPQILHHAAVAGGVAGSDTSCTGFELRLYRSPSWKLTATTPPARKALCSISLFHPSLSFTCSLSGCIQPRGVIRTGRTGQGRATLVESLAGRCASQILGWLWRTDDIY